jgi:hypothetical protein
MDYVEILTESRSFDITRTSIEQSIVLQFKLPADDHPAYPQNKAMFLGDDSDILALEIAYSLFPPGRWAPAQDPGSPDSFMILTTLKLEEVDNYGWWKASATYTYDINTGEGGSRGDVPGAPTLPFVKIGFAVGGQTKKITQSLQILRADQALGSVARVILDSDLVGNAIGLTEDGVEGAEIYASGLQLQITAYYFPQSVTWNFLKMMYAMVPSVNADQFFTFAPGEVLLYGVDGQATVSDIIPITFSVEVKPNIINQPDPPFVPLTCPGHSILDYRYVKSLDEGAQIILKMPTYRYVHRGYKATVFANLGFPTQ